MTTNDDDEWKVVSKNDKKLVATNRRSNRRRHTTNYHGNDNSQVEKTLHKQSSSTTASSSSLGKSSPSLSPEQVVRVIEKCKIQLASTNFWKDMTLTLHETFSSRPFRQMVCYGIGNFITSSLSSTSSYSAPMWQLAAALLIRDVLEQQWSDGTNEQDSSRISNIDVYYYDPCMTEDEGKVLKIVQIATIPNNERGKRTVDESTFFYMPHCPMNLYTNVLSSNWEHLVDRVAIFGNNLSSYANRLEEKPSPGVNLLNILLPYLQQHVVAMTKSDIRDMPGYFENAFNDSCITFFHTKTDVGEFPDRPSVEEDEEDSANQELL